MIGSTRVEGGDPSPLELTESALARAASLGRELCAFIALDPEGARRAARRAERSRAQGRRLGPLHAVPITVKDLILTKGMPTTAGSRALGPSPPRDHDAKLLVRLRRAGAVLIGKTNLNEFAYGVTGENAHFGNVVNPWHAGHMTGGSSSGSAAALAAGIGALSVGTDTRGSIRIPASCCGITGLKPTRDLVTTEGVFPLSWTLDHAGPMGRSAEDVALMLGVMAGGRGGAGRYLEALERPVRGLELGIPSFFFRELDEEVEAAVRTALAALQDAGVKARALEIPELDDALRASAVIASAEALAVHDKRLGERRDSYSPAVLARLEKGYELTALDLVRAERVRLALIDAYGRAFRDVGMMAGPTLPGLPAPVGATTLRTGGGREEWIVDASCRLVAPQNMTGTPAISIPCGFSRSGLPIGLQIWGPPGGDALVLALAAKYQEMTDWHLRRPPLAL